MVEQMDYIERDTLPRNVAVMKSIAPAASIVYCELAKCNQHFADEVRAAETDSDLTDLLERVLATGFISSKVNPSEIAGAAADFEALSVNDKKRFILELLDKNMLYVNLCDLDDEEYDISDADKAFTRSFYGMEDN